VAVVVAAALDLLAALVPQDLPLAGSASLARALAAALQASGGGSTGAPLALAAFSAVKAGTPIDVPFSAIDAGGGPLACMPL